MLGATWGLAISSFAAAFVEFVEAATIVLAMGTTRGWRSALAGATVAVLALAGVTALSGYALTTWLSEQALQLLVGTLLLIFGLQWLRKAILRSAGLKDLHDEEEEYAEQTSSALAAPHVSRLGLDAFGFVVSFKGVFLEGVEVVFIVITFGLSADNVQVAVVGAAAAGLLVLVAGIALRRPLAAVPENSLKYGVGLLLTSFGSFWALEGLGFLRSGQEGFAWPGGDWAILAVIASWFLVSRLLIRILPRVRRRDRASVTADVVT